jgi:hypothetical protein
MNGEDQPELLLLPIGLHPGENEIAVRQDLFWQQHSRLNV